MPHLLVDLARSAIGHYLRTGRILAPDGDPPKPVFVSLHDSLDPGTAEGRLRGCRGSLEPVTPSLHAEVCRQAVLAATDDPRCEPVRPSEVDLLDIAVYLLGPLQSIDGGAELDPARFGVLVEGRSGRMALLLPGIAGIDDPEVQVALTRRKAGIGPSEPVQLFRFPADILR